MIGEGHGPVAHPLDPPLPKKCLSVDFVRSELYKKHSLIARYLRIVIKLSILLTVSFSSLHCVFLVFLVTSVHGFYCTFIRAFAMMYVTHNK